MKMTDLTKLTLMARIEAAAEFARRRAEKYGAGHHHVVIAASYVLRLITQYRKEFEV